MSARTPTSHDRASIIRASIIAETLHDIEQRLQAVRCPVDGTALTRIHVSANGDLQFDGCCGAVTEARRVATG